MYIAKKYRHVTDGVMGTSINGTFKGVYKISRQGHNKPIHLPLLLKFQQLASAPARTTTLTTESHTLGLISMQTATMTRVIETVATVNIVPGTAAMVGMTVPVSHHDAHSLGVHPWVLEY